MGVKLPPVKRGMKRVYRRCKARGCGRAYYFDFIPYGLGSGVMWTDCGHSIGVHDYNLTDITWNEFQRRHAKEKSKNKRRSR